MNEKGERSKVAFNVRRKELKPTAELFDYFSDYTAVLLQALE